MRSPTPRRKSLPPSDDRYYKTHDLSLAAYLYTQGLWLSGADKRAEGRYCFVFQEPLRCEKLVRQFQKSPQVLVDARTFAYALEELRRRANQLRCDVSYE